MSPRALPLDFCRLPKIAPGRETRHLPYILHESRACFSFRSGDLKFKCKLNFISTDNDGSRALTLRDALISRAQVLSTGITVRALPSAALLHLQSRIVGIINVATSSYRYKLPTKLARMHSMLKIKCVPSRTSKSIYRQRQTAILKYIKWLYNT